MKQVVGTACTWYAKFSLLPCLKHARRFLSAFVYNLIQVLSGNKFEQREQQQKHLKSLVMRASNEMMEKLIAGGAEINCTRSDGLTPLMLALSKVSNFFSF